MMIRQHNNYPGRRSLLIEIHRESYKQGSAPSVHILLTKFVYILYHIISYLSSMTIGISIGHKAKIRY